MRRAARLLAPALFALAACGGGGDLGPPEGWASDGAGRWWRQGTDTTGAFRDLDSLTTMGVRVFDDEPVVRVAQQRLHALYVSDPELADSAFVTYALPILRAGAPSIPGPGPEWEALLREANREVQRHFRPPYQLASVRVPLEYPDSLRERGIGGTARLQVRVDETGAPQAVRLLDSAGNATLDAIAMRAVTQFRWSAGWFERRVSPMWVQTSVPFTP